MRSYESDLVTLHNKKKTQKWISKSFFKETLIYKHSMKSFVSELVTLHNTKHKNGYEHLLQKKL